MNFYVNQSINIHYLRIGGVSNASVFQIGSAGMIRSTTELKNSGGYTKTVEPLVAPGQVITHQQT
ncbi:MAG: spore germination protein GerPB [Bacillaceae bacterium]